MQMDDRIRITKVPDCIDIKKALVEEMVAEYCNKCPACGETKTLLEYLGEGEMKGITNGIHTTWYGKKDELHNPLAMFRFWEKNRHWEVKHCSCKTCGCQWESPSIPY